MKKSEYDIILSKDSKYLKEAKSINKKAKSIMAFRRDAEGFVVRIERRIATKQDIKAFKKDIGKFLKDIKSIDKQFAKYFHKKEYRILGNSLLKFANKLDPISLKLNMKKKEINKDIKTLNKMLTAGVFNFGNSEYDAGDVFRDSLDVFDDINERNRFITKTQGVFIVATVAAIALFLYKMWRKKRNYGKDFKGIDEKKGLEQFNEKLDKGLKTFDDALKIRLKMNKKTINSFKTEAEKEEFINKLYLDVAGGTIVEKFLTKGVGLLGPKAEAFAKSISKNMAKHGVTLDKADVINKAAESVPKSLRSIYVLFQKLFRSTRLSSMLKDHMGDGFLDDEGVKF